MSDAMKAGTALGSMLLPEIRNRCLTLSEADKVVFFAGLLAPLAGTIGAAIGLPAAEAILQSLCDQIEACALKEKEKLQ